METIVIEFGQNMDSVALHAKNSLSNLVGALENIPGVVLVTQPGYNAIELYLERNYYTTHLKRDTLKARLKVILRDYNLVPNYVNS